MRQLRASRHSRGENVTASSPLKPDVDYASKASKRGSAWLSAAVAALALLCLVWFFYLRHVPGGVILVPGPVAGSGVGAEVIEQKKNSVKVMKVDDTCTDPTWCTIPMPSKSHFAFAPVPSDEDRWREAQRLASNGVPILSREIRAKFPNPEDFLDGDPVGQNYDRMMDMYMNYDTMFAPLTANKHMKAVTVPETLRGVSKAFNRVTYENSYGHRAPLVQVGTYKYTGKKWVNREGDNLRIIDLTTFLREFEAIESKLVQPAIYFAALNKDWGYLSESIPQRVQTPPLAKGQRHITYKPISEDDKARLRKALDSDKIVMLIVNQHCNFTHPKLLVLPYGLNLDSSFDKKTVWDSLNFVTNSGNKTHLVYSGCDLQASGRIITNKVKSYFTPTDWLDEPPANTEHVSAAERRTEYFQHIHHAKVGLFLPDIGMDSERHWEMLYMGMMGVSERRSGLSKLYWKLPVLLVDDFLQLSPALLRAAYLEVVYNRKEFQFDRLRQSYWNSLIYNVSRNKSTHYMSE